MTLTPNMICLPLYYEKNNNNFQERGKEEEQIKIGTKKNTENQYPN